MKSIALIPAYKPTDCLIKTVKELLESKCFEKVVCVNDGSGEDFRDIFYQLQELDIIILEHATNLGKGSALKTGFNYVALNFPQAVGVVTLDADGQHLSKDCCAVAKALEENPNKLVLGVRAFAEDDIPFRSKFGNVMTSKILKFFTGIKLKDTQTGLRGIPYTLLRDILKLKATGYEFELDMLILSHSKKILLEQIPIATIYLDNNSSSHFNPFLDSLKIYMLFFRFVFSSLFTFLFDTFIFAISMLLGASTVSAIFIARVFAGTINYTLNKNFVFKSVRSPLFTIILYIITVICMGLLSYGIIILLTKHLSINVISAKIISEFLIYGISFIVQRDLVFFSEKKQEVKTVTDWEQIYKKRSIFSYITSKLAFRSLYKEIRSFSKNPQYLLELGGANSIFYNAYKKYFPDSKIYLVDQCESTDLFLKKTQADIKLTTIKSNILLDVVEKKDFADLVLSFGLIEHFSPTDTATIIAKHFEYAKPNAIVFISFPTPTKRYKFTRAVLELLNKWSFHDERPLLLDEVKSEADKYGKILYTNLSHRLGLSQRYLVYRKNSKNIL